MLALYFCFSMSIPTLLFCGVVYVHDYCGHPRVAIVEIYSGKCKQRCLACGSVHLRDATGRRSGVRRALEHVCHTIGEMKLSRFLSHTD
jgi:hypothetical protein